MSYFNELHFQKMIILLQVFYRFLNIIHQIFMSHQSVESDIPSKSGTEGVAKVISLMSKEFNSSDPLVLCKKLLQYLNSYTDQLEEKRRIGELQTTTPNIKIQTAVAKQDKDALEKDQIMVYPSRKTKWIRNITASEQKMKYQEQKFIAMSFCNIGTNYHFITLTYPQMPPKTYRCYVEAINNQTVNEIVDFLRYECNVQVQRLNRDQKRSIRTQLTKIKEWLGNIDPPQLQTFYQFIRRHYDKAIQIKFDDALKLYKTIVQIIKSPYVNVLEAVEGVDKNQSDDNLTKQEEKAMIILFIKSKDINKVSDGLCQKYGYDMRWSQHYVKERLKQLLNASLDKLINNFKQKQKDIYQHYFDNKRREMLQENGQIDLKIKLLSYYLEKKTSYMKVKDLIQKLREFYQIFCGETSSGSDPSVFKIQQTEEMGVKKEQFTLVQSMSLSSVFVKLQKEEEPSIKQQSDQQTQPTQHI